MAKHSGTRSYSSSHTRKKQHWSLGKITTICTSTLRRGRGRLSRQWRKLKLQICLDACRTAISRPVSTNRPRSRGRTPQSSAGTLRIVPIPSKTCVSPRLGSRSQRNCHTTQAHRAAQIRTKSLRYTRRAANRRQYSCHTLTEGSTDECPS